MKKEILNLHEQLRNHRFDYDLLQKLPCSKKENKEYAKLLKDNGALPDGVYAYVYENGEVSNTEFYTVYETDLTETERTEYLMYKKLEYLRTMKNCAMFFTVLTIIEIFAALIIALIIM